MLYNKEIISTFRIEKYSKCTLYIITLDLISHDNIDKKFEYLFLELEYLMYS